MAVRIAAAHDSDIMLEGMRGILEADHRFCLAAFARCTADLLAVVQATPLDLVLLSDRLYGGDLVETVGALRDLAPNMRLIILGTAPDGHFIHDLLRFGVSGYLDWADSLCDLLPIAVQTVLLNRPFLSPTAHSEYLTSPKEESISRPLTREAYRVLHLLREGYTMKQIAADLNLPLKRTYKIRDRLRERFDARTNEELIVRAASINPFK